MAKPPPKTDPRTGKAILRPLKDVTVFGRKLQYETLPSGAYRIFDQTGEKQLGYVFCTKRDRDPNSKKIADVTLEYGFQANAFEGEPLPDAYRGAYPRMLDAVAGMLAAPAKGKR